MIERELQGPSPLKEQHGGEGHSEQPPRVCFARSGVVGVIKPPGLPTQAPPGNDSLAHWLRSQHGDGGYLGVPHRLDRAVSGVMLFAVTPRAARQLSRQFERRQIEKTYLALTELSDSSQSGGSHVSAPGPWSEWIDWVAKIPNHPRGRITAAGDPAGRQAETRVRQIGTIVAADGSLVAMLQLEPRTGRMHQLRLQAAARAMPIVGDGIYGARCNPEQSSAVDAIALHAWRIAFTDPDTRHRVVLEAPLPETWPSACRDVLAAAACSHVTGTESSPHE